MIDEKLSLWGARESLEEGQAAIIVNIGGRVRVIEGPCDKKKNEQWLEERLAEVRREHSGGSLYVIVQRIEK